MKKLTARRKGISFVEVMVTVVVMASGFTGVFQAYLASMDYLDYLNTRLYMNFLLDQRITDMQRQFGMIGTVAQSTHTALETIEINRKAKLVEFHSRFDKVDKVDNLLHVTISATWGDGGRRAKLVRQAYLRR